MKTKIEKQHLIILAVLVLSAAVFSVIQLTTASPAAPNPGHSWNQMECDNNLCINVGTGRVGIGITDPGQKLDVAGGDIRTGGEFRTASNEGSCPLWKDCDGDGKTGGSGDCDETLSTSYVGSKYYTVSPDNKDQNCNEVVDDSVPAVAYCITEDAWCINSSILEQCIGPSVQNACNAQCATQGFGGMKAIVISSRINLAGPYVCQGRNWYEVSPPSPGMYCCECQCTGFKYY